MLQCRPRWILLSNNILLFYIFRNIHGDVFIPCLFVKHTHTRAHTHAHTHTDTHSYPKRLSKRFTLVSARTDNLSGHESRPLEPGCLEPVSHFQIRIKNAIIMESKTHKNNATLATKGSRQITTATTTKYHNNTNRDSL